MDEKQIHQNIGHWLRHMRMRAGLTQRAAGKACHISYQQIQKFESGINRISAVQFLQLCHLYEVDYGQLAQGLIGSTHIACPYVKNPPLRHALENLLNVWQQQGCS